MKLNIQKNLKMGLEIMLAIILSCFSISAFVSAVPEIFMKGLLGLQEIDIYFLILGILFALQPMSLLMRFYKKF